MKVVPVEAAAALLVGWWQEGEEICRRYELEDWREALRLVELSQAVGARRGRFPRVALCGRVVELRLPPAGETDFTEEDLLIARVLETRPEAVVAAEGGR